MMEQEIDGKIHVMVPKEMWEKCGRFLIELTNWALT